MPQRRIATLNASSVCLLLAGVGAALGLIGMLTGCGEALLDEKGPRSQYDRYDALRGQRPASHIENEFGEDKPNLRGRLLRRD